MSQRILGSDQQEPPVHPVVARAGDAMVAADYETAEALLRALLRERPGDPIALRMLGEIAATFGALRPAESLHRQALEIDPAFGYARLHLAITLLAQQRNGEALAEFERLTEPWSDLPQTLALKASALARVGEYASAIAITQRLVEADSTNIDAWIDLANAFRSVGRYKEAATAYREALKAAPLSGELWWSLASVLSGALTDDEVAALTNGIDSTNTSGGDRVGLHFALGRVMERRRDVDASWSEYQKGNRMRGAEIRYDPARTEQLVERTRAVFTRDFLRAREDWGDPAPDPIFIVGLPRSGSTLVEQILASHPLIEGTSELADIDILARSLEQDPRWEADWREYPQLLATLPHERIRELGALYLQRTRINRKSGRPLYIDKMPNNWLHVGFIRMILPGAKIIDARRNPLACGFSNFKQLYARGHGFSYDLSHFGRYYAAYTSLMQHFDEVASGHVHRIVHERLVDDPEQEVRRLLAFLSVPYDEACLRFEENERPVRTASAEQVRQGIRTDWKDDWRAYEAFLDPLKAVLGSVLREWNT